MSSKNRSQLCNNICNNEKWSCDNRYNTVIIFNNVVITVTECNNECNNNGLISNNDGNYAWNR